MSDIKIKDTLLMKLIYWARRYCDGRRTEAPHSFNEIYMDLITNSPHLTSLDPSDFTLTNSGKYFPYAQDGDFSEDSPAFDARPVNIIRWTNIKNAWPPSNSEVVVCWVYADEEGTCHWCSEIKHEKKISDINSPALFWAALPTVNLRKDELA